MLAQIHVKLKQKKRGLPIGSVNKKRRKDVWLEFHFLAMCLKKDSILNSSSTAHVQRKSLQLRCDFTISISVLGYLVSGRCACDLPAQVDENNIR